MVNGWIWIRVSCCSGEKKMILYAFVYIKCVALPQHYADTCPRLSLVELNCVDMYDSMCVMDHNLNG